jgi:hypothetical protein
VLLLGVAALPAVSDDPLGARPPLGLEIGERGRRIGLVAQLASERQGVRPSATPSWSRRSTAFRARPAASA